MGRLRRIFCYILTAVLIIMYVPTPVPSMAEESLPQETQIPASAEDTQSASPTPEPTMEATVTPTPEATAIPTPETTSIPTPELPVETAEASAQPSQTPIPQSEGTPHPYLTFVQVVGGWAVSGCAADIVEAVVPAMYMDQPVIRLAKGAFYQCSRLESVLLPSGCLAIEAKAFDSCGKLVRVVIPETVTDIEKGAFTACPLLAVDAPEASIARAYALAEGIPLWGQSAATPTPAQGQDVLVTPMPQENKPESVSIPATAEIPKPSLRITGAATLTAKKKTTLKATLVNGAGMQPTVTWKSSDTKTATVSSQGVVTALAVKQGKTVTITATLVADNSISATFLITIQPLATKVNITTPSSSIDLTGSNPTLLLKAACSPSSAGQQVTWSSSNIKIASVNAGGLVTARGKGMVKITAAAKDGSGAKASMTLTIVSLVQSVKLTGATTVMEGKTITLKAQVLPATATNPAVKWSTSNSAVATVSSKGVVTAKMITGTKASKTVSITAASVENSNLSASIVITVYPTATGVTVKAPGKTSINLNYAGGVVQLTASVKPGDARQLVTWKSSNTKIATVDKNGRVKGLKSGGVIITATAVDGSLKSGKISLTFIRGLSGITISNPGTLVGGASVQLSKKTLPANAENISLKWYSSDTSVATVTSGGYLTAKLVASTSTVTITAVSALDEVIQHAITVTVRPRVESVILTAPSSVIDLSVSRTLSITANVLPTEAAKTMLWVSSDTAVASVKGSDGGTAIVTGVKTGKVTITAYASERKTVTGRIVLEVIAPVQSVSVQAAATTLISGKTVQLTGKALPAEASQQFTWQSSDTSVATVDTNGLVTAKAVAAKTTVTITGISVQNKAMTGAVTLIVIPAAQEVVITAPATIIDLSLSIKTVALTTIITPSDANQAVTWTSSNPSVISVDANGVATGLKLGTATIIATSAENASVKATVLMEAVHTVQSVSVQAAATTLISGKTVQLTGKALPAEASQRFTWQSSDSSIAAVDANGLVTAKAVAAKTTVTITGISVQNTAMTAAATLSVIPLTSSLSIDPVSGSLNLRAAVRTAQLAAKSAPADATPNPLWSSNHPNIATVSAGGLVTAVAVGTARITAAAQDGSGLSAFIDIVVVSMDYYSTPVQGGTQITAYMGTDTSLTLPQSIGGLTVVSIADNVFAGNTAIVRVTLPSGLKAIGKGAFMNCTNLASVSLPNSVNAIGENVFSGCIKLTEMNPY